MANTHKNIKTPKSPSKKASPQVKPHETVAVAAYYKAEQRSFEGGDPVHDWLEAEQEINAQPA